ncbi:MAG: hypothetical protein GTN36_02705 [Candidatus Aenigmarchaeota archaeon]|nr:hypothetical protein [Candidatus Aenigmarchaeota archaeon]
MSNKLKTNLIAFTGTKGVGKSTARDILKALCKPFVNMLVTPSLADPIKHIASMANQYLGRKDVKDRKLLQLLGTEWGRNTISQDIWIDRLHKNIEEHIQDPNDLVIIDDVRFDNEAKYIKNNNGILIRVCGPSRIKNDGIKGHASESGVHPMYIDITLNNNTNIKEFHNSIVELLFDHLMKSGKND